MKSTKELRDLFLPKLPSRFSKTKSIEAPIEVIEKPVVHKQDAPTLTKEPDLFLHDDERDDAFCSIDIWIRKNKDLRPLLLVGPCGSGKTFLITKYAESFEVYHDEDIEDFISSSSLRKKPIGVIDSIESLDQKEKELLKKNIQSLKRRLIFTAEDLFSEPAKTWKKFCTTIQLKGPSQKFLKKVYEASNLHFNGELGFPVKSVSSGHRDLTSDPIRCTRDMLYGRSVPELLSDTSYLNTLLQANCLQTSTSIHEIAKALDRYSFTDLVDRELDSQSFWHLTELITKNNPKMTNSMPWTFQWSKTIHKTNSSIVKSEICGVELRQ
jgi:hypothetical protein